MNKVLEERIALLADRFVLAEKLNEKELDKIEITVHKVASDRMMLNYYNKLSISDYQDEDIYINTIKFMAAKVNMVLTAREKKDITTCDHKITMIGTEKACQYCMAKFGALIEITGSIN